MNPIGLAAAKKRRSAALNSSPAQPKTAARGNSPGASATKTTLFPSPDDTPAGSLPVHADTRASAARAGLKMDRRIYYRNDGFHIGERGARGSSPREVHLTMMHPR